MHFVMVTIAMVLAVRVVAWGAAGPLAAARAGMATFDELLAVAAAAAVLVLLAWIAAVLAITALTALPGVLGEASVRVAGRIAPGVAGRVARLALGLSLTAGPVSACTPALAGGGSEHPSQVVAAEPVGDSGLPGVGRIGEVIAPEGDPDTDAMHQPPAIEPPTGPASFEPPTGPTTGPTTWPPTGSATERPVAQPPTAPFSTDEPTPQPSPTPDAGLTAEPTREHRRAGEVVVKRGDTLWAIAARQLGASATAAEIAAEWPRWYTANRAVIGDDPDLILPGMILRSPTHR
ncbi:MAG TPA: LysM peptidoglycan-binding domain-containing protein [Jiangellaceae bacterium]